MKKKLYTLTDEHRAQLKPWADKWIANAMSTRPMDEADREICRDSVERMYRAAKLTPPPRHRIVFVPSPFVGRFAAGFAAAIWWMRKNPRSPLSTYAATNAATNAATDAATRDATYAAATEQQNHNNWFFVPCLKNIIKFGGSLAKNNFAIMCAQSAWKFYQGGNAWSGWSSYLTFFRYVAKLDIDYTAFDPFEKLSEHSGYRFVHPEFCIISDRPEILTVNESNQPHNDTGPFCRWRDGSELYALNGVRIPAKYILTPAEQLKPADILKEPNADVRRELIRRVGIEQMLAHLPHKVLDTQGDYTLLRVDFPGMVDDTRFLKMLNPSIGVWHMEGVERTCNTVQEAINWRAGVFGNVEWKPAQLT